MAADVPVVEVADLAARVTPPRAPVTDEPAARSALLRRDPSATARAPPRPPLAVTVEWSVRSERTRRSSPSRRTDPPTVARVVTVGRTTATAVPRAEAAASAATIEESVLRAVTRASPVVLRVRTCPSPDARMASVRLATRPRPRAAALRTGPSVVRAAPVREIGGVVLVEAPAALPSELTNSRPVELASMPSRPTRRPINAAPSTTARVVRSTAAVAVPAPAAASEASPTDRASVSLVASTERALRATTCDDPPRRVSARLASSTVARAASAVRSPLVRLPTAVADPCAREVLPSVTSPLDRRAESSTRTRAEDVPRTSASLPKAVPVVDALAARVRLPPLIVAPLTVTDAEDEESVPVAVSLARSEMSPSPAAPVVSMVEPLVTTMSRARMTKPVDASRIVPVTTTVPAGDSMTMRTRPSEARSAEVSPVRTRTVPVSASYVTVPLPVSEMVALPSVLVQCGPAPVVAVVVPVDVVDVVAGVPVPADPVVESAAGPSVDPAVASPSVGSGSGAGRGLVGRGRVGGSGLGVGLSRGLLRRLLGGGLVGGRCRLLFVGQGRGRPDAALLARRQGLVHEAAVGVVQPEHVADLVAHDGDEAHLRPAPPGGVGVDDHARAGGAPEGRAGEVLDARGDAGHVTAGVGPLALGLGQCVGEAALGQCVLGADRGIGKAGGGERLSGGAGRRGGGRAGRRRRRDAGAATTGDGAGAAVVEGAGDGGGGAVLTTDGRAGARRERLGQCLEGLLQPAVGVSLGLAHGLGPAGLLLQGTQPAQVDLLGAGQPRRLGRLLAEHRGPLQADRLVTLPERTVELGARLAAREVRNHDHDGVAQGDRHGAVRRVGRRPGRCRGSVGARPGRISRGGSGRRGHREGQDHGGDHGDGDDRPGASTAGQGAKAPQGHEGPVANAGRNQRQRHVPARPRVHARRVVHRTPMRPRRSRRADPRTALISAPGLLRARVTLNPERARCHGVLGELRRVVLT